MGVSLKVIQSIKSKYFELKSCQVANVNFVHM